MKYSDGSHKTRTQLMPDSDSVKTFASHHYTVSNCSWGTQENARFKLNFKWIKSLISEN